MKKKIFCSVIVLSFIVFNQSAVFSANSSEDNIQNLLITNSCVECDLKDSDLSRRDLRGADLRGANLQNVKFQFSDLNGANLQGADLTGAQCGGADLSGADLRGAKYTAKVLNGAYLANTVYGSAEDQEALSSTRQDNLIAEESSAPVVEQGGADKPAEVADNTPKSETAEQKDDRQLADASSAVTDEQQEPGSTDKPAVAEDTKKAVLIEDVVIEKPTEPEQVEIAGKQEALEQETEEQIVAEAATAEQPLVEAEPVIEPVKQEDEDVLLGQAEAAVQAPTVEMIPEEKRAAIDEEMLDGLKRNKGCYQCNFANYDLRGMDFEGFDFEGTDFSGADLTGTDLEACNLKGADFTGSLLVKTDLRGADFYKAKLVQANLEGAKTDGALMDGAVLDGIEGYNKNLVELQ